MASVVLVGLLGACAQPMAEITLSGVVLDAPYGEGEVVAGLQVLARDANLEKYGETTTDSDGSFELAVASAQDVFLELTGSGYSKTLFGGEAGIFDMPLADGELWVRDAGWGETLAETFGDCAGSADGGIVEGEIRLYLPGSTGSEATLVGNGWVRAISENGVSYHGCYLDEKGNPAPDQTMTNETGRFAIFDLPNEPLMLEVAYGEEQPEDIDELSDEIPYWYYKVNMVEGGVAPFYPAWVEVSY